ncbi:MAG: AAA family ATPase [Muribaculaceae bacterium]|nr:AAA family ATPase [Muribaculaceae bacterium]
MHLPGPQGQDGLRAFLESGFIPGIGKVYAQRIEEKLGERLSDIAALCEEDFRSVEGIGPKSASAIVEAIKNLPASPNFLQFLFSCGLGYLEITKILNKYRRETLKVVLDNPYEMVEDVWKFSFFRADRIGRRLGIATEDPRRLKGALLTAVKLHAERGSLFARREQLFATASNIAGRGEETVVEENDDSKIERLKIEAEKIKPEKFQPALESLISEERLVESLGGIYLPVYYNAEEETAGRLASLISEGSPREDFNFDLPDRDLEGHYFTEEQLEAIKMARDNPVSIITGDPGTGKTTTVRGLIRLFQDEGKRVILTAPTGRSAKKMEMMAGESAKTIHRLLGFNRGKGYFNKKLEADVLIIDEASLLEQVLFNHLLNALPDNIKIVLVGDVGQLPPIGAGKVLEDLLDSRVVPVARLTRNFRQEQGSLLAANIQNIKKGQMPEGSEEGDFAIIYEEDEVSAKDKVIEMVTKILPSKFMIAPADVQVVSPQHDGPLGTSSLNEALQEALQKEGTEISYGAKKFRMGDRVVQSVNSSRRGIYNGETGKIVEVNPDAGFLRVEFADGKMSTYLKKEFGELQLAYATSVHKLQGTETDFVVMPLTTSHERLLHRNLLLTAVGRARKFCGLIGEREALERAVASSPPFVRNSNLKQRLQDKLRFSIKPEE